MSSLCVHDSPYDNREWIFVKIKNWNSCVPEDIPRSAYFIPIYPFEALTPPQEAPESVLDRRIGGSVEKTEDGKHECGGIGKEPKKTAAGNTAVSQMDYAGPSRGDYVGPPTSVATG